jgi:hypothetical protein
MPPHQFAAVLIALCCFGNISLAADEKPAAPAAKPAAPAAKPAAPAQTPAPKAAPAKPAAKDAPAKSADPKKEEPAKAPAAAKKDDSPKNDATKPMDKPKDPPAAPPVEYFPDPQLKAVIQGILKQKQINKKDIDPEDLKTIYFLDARDQGIKNLSGLERCPHLAEVKLSGKCDFRFEATRRAGQHSVALSLAESDHEPGTAGCAGEAAISRS